MVNSSMIFVSRLNLLTMSFSINHLLHCLHFSEVYTQFCLINSDDGTTHDLVHLPSSLRIRTNFLSLVFDRNLYLMGDRPEERTAHPQEVLAQVHLNKALKREGFLQPW